MPEGDKPLSASDFQAPRPRIVQYRNRRYSIRLEPVFWQVLDQLARREGVRLGRYIADLADRSSGANFSSYLRVKCMLEAEQALARAELGVGGRDGAGIVELVETAFTPGLLLSRYRTIVLCNEAFLNWMEDTSRPPHGADLTSLLQVRTRGSLNALWLDMVAGSVSGFEASVLRVDPGRVLTARARVVAMPMAGDRDFRAVMWLAPGRRSAPARDPGGIRRGV